MPKSGGAHRHVIYVPSVKNQYKRVVIGYMVDLSRDERPALSVSGLVTGVSEPYLDIDT